MPQTRTEKILNDYLFAPARYLDQQGHPVDANFLNKYISAPGTKTGVLAAIGCAFAAAAAGAPFLMIGGLVSSAAYTVANQINPPLERSPFNTVPKYFFDTQPEKSTLIGDIHILSDLRYKKKMLKWRLLTSASPIAIAFPAIWGMLHITGMDPTTNFQFTSIAMATALTASATTNIATAWRAAQALKGNWNILTHKPDLQTEVKREHTYVGAPQPSQG